MRRRMTLCQASDGDMPLVCGLFSLEVLNRAEIRLQGDFLVFIG